jgi:DNA-binding MarR family transcriptional regulator
MRMATPRAERLDQLEFRGWRAFLYAYAKVVPTLDLSLVRSQNLSLNQFEVLAWLARAGRRGLRMSDLASRIVLSPSGVTRVVDRLEQRGLVERCVFEGDKRGSVATLTGTGRTLLRTAANVQVLDVREHFLKHLSRQQLEQLTTALEAVLDGEGSPLPPLSAS